MADLRKKRLPRHYDDDKAYTKKKFDYSNVQGFRFLIPTKAGGCMIGKGGEVIKKLRAQFSCRIIVPDSQGPERMVIMDGEIDVIIDCWKEIIPYIKDFINGIENDFKNTGNRHIEDENELDLRLVVHESQAGALIGKGGERIRNLIDIHKMTIIKVYQTFCPNSTDRVVRLVASEENLLGCIKSMLKLLENQVVKGVRNDYDPDNYDETAAPTYGGFISKDSRFPPRLSNNKLSGGFRNSDYDTMRSGLFTGSSSRNATNSGVNDLLNGVMRIGSGTDSQKHVSMVAMPIHLVSAVIGTDGHRLSDIKRDSGAQIQLDEQRLNEREELFLIRGTADQIYKAQCLMQLCARKYGDLGHYGY